MENENAPSGNITKNLGNAGPALMTNIAGHDIACKLIDQKVKARLENILIERAKNDLRNEKDSLDSDEYLAALSDLRDKKITGHYSFGGAVMQNWLRSIDGISQVLGVCSNLGPDIWAELIISDSLEVNMLLQEILDNSFPDIGESKKKTA